MLPATLNGVKAARIGLAGPEVYHLPKWRDYADPKRLAAMRQIVMTEGRDPRVADVAVGILNAANVPARAYHQQAAALLSWVQTNIYYVNEPGERLQSPLYTLQHGYADCDCLAILLASLFEAVALPWRFVLSGYPARLAPGETARPVRFIEGGKKPPGYRWTHIYLTVGAPPFRPRPDAWVFCEPSARVPFGWDVVGHAASTGAVAMPELVRPQDTALGAIGAIGAISQTWETVKEKLELPAIVEEVKTNLQWRRLAVTVASGAIMGLLTQAVIFLTLQWWKRRSRASR
jgi:hypothetical protein